MKLITKTTLLYLLLALLVFSVGGWLTLKAVENVVRQETDYSLRTQLRLLKHSIEEGNPISALQNARVEITPIDSTEWKENSHFYSDTLVYHRPVDRLEPFRKLVAKKKIAGNFYKISVTDVFIETNDMQEGVLKTMLWLFILLSLTFLICSFLISNILFQPFQKILHAIRGFNLKKNEPLDLPTTSTKEFKELTELFQSMSNKAQQDYQSLKEFSENASHEMQTPIAVAKGKLELLLESNALDRQQLHLVQDAQMSLSKLTKLGQALTLLTKLENKEFSNPKAINFSKIVQKTFSNFNELAELQGLKMGKLIAPDVFLKMEEPLADILVSNLLKNAVQHNIENGWIDLSLTSEALIVKNSGNPPSVSTNLLFERFRKSDQTGGSLGLGLAIVKRICEIHDFEIEYGYSQEIHELKVSLRR